MSCGAVATIEPGAVAHNLSVIKASQPKARVMAALKANAYGHGAIEIGAALHAADSFALARIDEAQALRDAGVDHALVLLEGVFDARDMQQAGVLDCELVVHSPFQVDLLAQYTGAPRVVWLKVNTGMNRLGFAPAAAHRALAVLRDLSAVAEVRVMSHFAMADSAGCRLTDRQIDAFRAFVNDFDGALSIANSAAIFATDASITTLLGELAGAREHWIRPGIALYGISPFADRIGADFGLRPAMRLQASMIAEQRLQAGDSVGYGGRFIAPQAMRVGIVAAGYGDGYPRMMPDGTPVLVGGEPASIAGMVSMDMLSIDLTGCPQATVGAPVCLWGPELPVERVAAQLGTIAYELVTCVSARVPRCYA